MIQDINPVQVAEKWQQELKLAKKEDEKWVKRGKKIIRRYRDERQGYSDTAKRFNVLWSNIQTLLPATYAKPPKAEVERRFKDQDPVGRTAAQILERALQYEIDTENDYDQAIKQALTDRLLPGRGTAWVRFETKERMTAQGPMQYECSPVDYVYWEDFRCQPARTWDEVTWVARRVYMSKADVVERFGEEFADVPMTHEPIGLEEMQKNGENVDSLRKAQVWEIWDKNTKRVCWVAEGYQKALDCVDDPYGLDSFWPCPKPLFATQSTDTLVPVPDFVLYQDQADEIDLLTQRINMLVKALKVVGVYDASQTGVQRMLSEGVDNTLIPVDTWAAFSEKGGIKGVVDFLPLDNVIQALQQCYQARDRAVQVVYEVTGLSDIIRGSSVASETATAQQIKSQFASLRLRNLQREVAVFASELLQIKAQMMCDLYSPQTLAQISGIQGTQDGQYAEQAIMLLKAEPARGYRIDVAADSLVELDEAQEKQDRIEFLTATGQFLQQALPVAQQVPQMAPLLAEMLLFGVRAFKGGRPLEAAFDAAMSQLSQPQQPQQQGPSPEEMQAQAQMQVEQGKMQMEQAKLQASMQIEQFKAEQAQQLEMLRQQAETQRAEMKARIDAETKMAIAQMQGESSLNVAKQTAKPAIDAEVIATSEGLRDGIVQQLQGLITQFASELNEVLSEQKEEAAELTQQLMQAVSSPRRLVRGPDGRVVGVEVNGVMREVQRGQDGRVEGI
jgi:hypothetical protein